ncbi:MAG: hypothetical protein WHV67_10865, partial [Thermoanaerobaculia bacterium]
FAVSQILFIVAIRAGTIRATETLSFIFEKGKKEEKKIDYGFIFFEDLVLQKCKIRFEEEEIPLEGTFRGFSLFFWKEKGFLNIKDGLLILPELGKINFSLKSSFKKEGKGLYFERILIKSRDFFIRAEGNFKDLKPTFSLNFNLSASLSPLLQFLNAGIGGKLQMDGNITYRRDIFLKGKGKIEKPEFLEKEIPELELMAKLDSSYLNLDFYKEKDKGSLKLS